MPFCRSKSLTAEGSWPYPSIAFHLTYIYNRSIKCIIQKDVISFSTVSTILRDKQEITRLSNGNINSSTLPHLLRNNGTLTARVQAAIVITLPWCLKERQASRQPKSRCKDIQWSHTFTRGLRSTDGAWTQNLKITLIAHKHMLFIYPVIYMCTMLRPHLRATFVTETRSLNKHKNQTNSVALVHKRTIPIERPSLVGKVSANFSR
jgi:hypothetical protein